MAKLNISTVDPTRQKLVAQASLNNTNRQSILSLVNTGARQFTVGAYVALWDKTTYANPSLDSNARIGVVTARTNSSVSIDWGQFGSPIVAYANRPTLAIVTMNGKDVQSADRVERSNADAVSVTVATSKTVNATTDLGLDQVVTVDGVNVTLPTPAAGYRVDVVNGGNTDNAVGFVVTPGSGVSVLGLNTVATAGQTIVNTKTSARVGDRLSLFGVNATTWVARAVGNFDRV